MNRGLLPLAAVLTALLLLVAVSPCPADEDEDRDLRRAVNAFDAKLYDFAHRSFSLFSMKYPQSESMPVVLLRMGICSYQLAMGTGKLEDRAPLLERSIRELQTVIDRHPLSTVEIEVRYWLGEVHLARKEYEKAREYFQFVLRSPLRTEYHQDSYMGLSYARFEEGDYAGALEALDELVREFTTPRRMNEYRFQKGMCLFFLDRFEEARELFLVLVEQEDDKDTAMKSLFWLAECYYKLDRYEDAIKYYFTVKKRKTDKNMMCRILYGLGHAYFKSGSYEDSLDTFRELLRFAPNCEFRDGTNFKIGEVLYRLGRYEDAIEAFAATMFAPEFRHSAMFFTGECLYRLGKFSEALEWLDGIPDDAAPEVVVLARRDAGLCWFELKEFDKASEQFRRMKELAVTESDRGAALVYLADSELSAGRVAEALESYREALTSYPGSINVPRVRYHIGLCLLRRDLTEEATEVFVNTYTRFEGSRWSAMALYQHGEILRKAGRFAEARAKHEEFVARAADDPGLALLTCRARLSIGVCIFNSGDIENALKEFQQLSRTSRDLQTAHEASFQAARCLFLLNRPKEGIKALRLLASAGEKTGFAPIAQLELANYFLSAGMDAEAKEEFEKLVAEFASSSQAEAGMYNLAALALKHGDPASAREWVARLLKEHPASDFAPSAEVLGASTLVAEGKLEDALAEYSRLMEKFAGRSIEHLVVVECGELLQKLERFEEALARFQKARASKVDDWAARAVFGAATCLRKLARSREALEEYLTLITTWPGDARRDNAILEGADIYTELGKFAEAIKLLELHSDRDRAQERIKRIRELMKAQ